MKTADACQKGDMGTASRARGAARLWERARGANRSRHCPPQHCARNNYVHPVKRVAQEAAQRRCQRLHQSHHTGWRLSTTSGNAVNITHFTQLCETLRPELEAF